MSGWTTAVAVFSRRGAGGCIVAGAGGDGDGLRAGFLAAFILFTTGPFATLPATRTRLGGARPEPAAAGPGADFHPPLLYMGYVGGFSVAFAFAHRRALLSGRLDNTVHRFARPWTLAAWVFTTLGIVLGFGVGLLRRAGLGRLGSGTRWRRSFMPWLAGTACCTALAVWNSAPASGRGRCCPSAPSQLCLLGALLARLRSGGAGVGSRAASDPARGILAFVVAGHRRLAAAVRRARRHGVRSREVERRLTLCRASRCCSATTSC
ncbi:cytochrome c biogenesis protein CcsA [Salmonella enterica subsp. enterica]|nr:cytochrome c biogenesis protein CcsA [Salmonella enterica subsp. enterica]